MNTMMICKAVGALLLLASTADATYESSIFSHLDHGNYARMRRRHRAFLYEANMEMTSRRRLPDVLPPPPPPAGGEQAGQIMDMFKKGGVFGQLGQHSNDIRNFALSRSPEEMQRIVDDPSQLRQMLQQTFHQQNKPGSGDPRPRTKPQSPQREIRKQQWSNRKKLERKGDKKTRDADPATIREWKTNHHLPCAAPSLRKQYDPSAKAKGILKKTLVSRPIEPHSRSAVGFGELLDTSQPATKHTRMYKADKSATGIFERAEENKNRNTTSMFGVHLNKFTPKERANVMKQHKKDIRTYKSRRVVKFGSKIVNDIKSSGGTIDPARYLKKHKRPCPNYNVKWLRTTYSRKQMLEWGYCAESLKKKGLTYENMMKKKETVKVAVEDGYILKRGGRVFKKMEKTKERKQVYNNEQLHHMGFKEACKKEDGECEYPWCPNSVYHGAYNKHFVCTKDGSGKCTFIWCPVSPKFPDLSQSTCTGNQMP